MTWDSMLLFAALSVYTVWGISLSVVDCRSYRLPNKQVACLTVGVLVCLIPAAAVGGSTGWAPLAAGFGYSLFMLILRAASGSVGGGDVKLAFPVGVMGGWASEWATGSIWPGVAWTLGMSCLIGWLAGLLMLARKKPLKSDIPFGPILLAGGYAPLLAGVWTPTGW